MAKRNRVRLNLEFSPQVAENLEKLQELSDSPSRVEVIRKALSLFDLALECQSKGGRLILKQPDGEEVALHLL